VCKIITTFFAAITCPQPEGVINGKVETTGRQRVNSLAIYTCNSGFTLGGFKQRRCNENGEWEGTPPTCYVTKQCKWSHSKLNAQIYHNFFLTVFCSNPGSITCGRTSYSNGALLSGTVVTFTPNDKAELLGPNQITCENGKWSGSVPKCRSE